MSFDPLVPSMLDRIRLITGDTGGDEAAEYFSDVTYEAAIVEHENWKLAAAFMADAVAVKIEQDPTSYTATGDFAVSWTDRTRSLRSQAIRLRQEAAIEDAAGTAGVISVALSRGGSVTPEYRLTQYRRLWR